MSEKGWRTPVDAGDYFNGQQKASRMEQRRPVVRRAGDLVGPGIGALATRLFNFNDPRTLFNGFYVASAGVPGAPVSTEPLAGTVVVDAEIGGVQVFYGLTTNRQFRRTFTRNPSSPTTLVWTAWATEEP